MRPSRFLIPTIACAVLLGGCMGDETMKLGPVSYDPAALDDGWQISTPQAEGFDGPSLASVFSGFHSEELYPTVQSLLVARNGKLVAEAYSRDLRDRERFHNLQSATKSVTSLLTGISIDLGLIGSVDTPLHHFMPDYFDGDAGKQDITLHHVLTMQTGLQFDNDRDTIELYNYGGNSVEFVLRRPLSFAPGAGFYYHDGNPQLISGVIAEVSGVSLEQFAVRHLFEPLRISNYQWEQPADGRPFGAFGLWLTPRDMAKIGCLMVQDGVWEGERIVSLDWLERSTRIHANSNYGYYWWITVPNTTFRAEGDGGQVIFVAKDKEVVIVLTGDPYSASYLLSPNLGGLIDRILAAAK